MCTLLPCGLLFCRTASAFFNLSYMLNRIIVSSFYISAFRYFRKLSFYLLLLYSYSSNMLSYISLWAALRHTNKIKRKTKTTIIRICNIIYQPLLLWDIQKYWATSMLQWYMAHSPYFLASYTFTNACYLFSDMPMWAHLPHTLESFKDHVYLHYFDFRKPQTSPACYKMVEKEHYICHCSQ